MPTVADTAALVRTHWPLKLARGVFLFVFFCVPYFALQRVTLFPVRTLPMTPLDHVIAFDPRWVWLYQSGYLLIVGVPWLFDSTAEIARYVRGFVLIACIGFACFLLLPVEGPRPNLVPETGMFAWLARYDRPTNELPSLHVALLAYTMLVAARASRGRMRPVPRTGSLTLAAMWAAAVCYAAVATKQHYVLDLPAGALVGWLAFRWSWT